jgi:hypothetical protein
VLVLGTVFWSVESATVYSAALNQTVSRAAELYRKMVFGFSLKLQWVAPQK